MPTPLDRALQSKSAFLAFTGIVGVVAAWSIWGQGDMFPAEPKPKIDTTRPSANKASSREALGEAIFSSADLKNWSEEDLKKWLEAHNIPLNGNETVEELVARVEVAMQASL